MKWIPNARRVAARSYAFLFSAASAVVGAAAIAEQFAPALVPALPDGATVPIMAALAGAAAVGRLIDQGLIPRPSAEKPAGPGEGGR